MSASLVGSEMCIRDREAHLLRVLDHAFRREPMNCFGPIEEQKAKCLIPVSYTHLTLPTICSV
eukprot:3516671-Alexandrium_andersonii.AAC.1